MLYANIKLKYIFFYNFRNSNKSERNFQNYNEGNLKELALIHLYANSFKLSE